MFDKDVVRTLCSKEKEGFGVGLAHAFVACLTTESDSVSLGYRGFCYFNNVAIAARLLRLKMSVERVLIVDWVCT